MHSIDPFVDLSSSRSKLGATLSRLHRHLEANTQREQAALELFARWESHSADQRDVITQRLESLARELSQLSPLGGPPAPHLTLLALPGETDDSEDCSAHDELQPADDDAADSIISLPGAPWNRA